MITYASFCSIFLFKQNSEQDLPLTSLRTTASQAVSIPTIQRGIWLQTTFRRVRPRISPRERRPHLRFATGGEEQEISEPKAVEKAIELSINVHSRLHSGSDSLFE